MSPVRPRWACWRSGSWSRRSPARGARTRATPDRRYARSTLALHPYRPFSGGSPTAAALPGVLPPRLRPSARLTDAAVAATVLAFTVLGTFGNGPSPGEAAARLGISLVGVVALWWRRRAALVVLAVTC